MLLGQSNLFGPVITPVKNVSSIHAQTSKAEIKAKYEPTSVKFELVVHTPQRPTNKIGELIMQIFSLDNRLKFSVNLTTNSIDPVENHQKNTAAIMAMKIEPAISMLAPFW